MQLKNKAERERFLKNYKNWELMHEVPELELKFYRYIFPNGTVIIATEHACMKFADYTPQHHFVYEKSTAVRYHLILDKLDKYKVQFAEYEYRVYNPSGDSKSAIVEYLTKTKPEIDSPENPSVATEVRDGKISPSVTFGDSSLNQKEPLEKENV